MPKILTLESVLCDICGKEMITDCSPEGNGVRILYRGGYDSEHIGDGVDLDLDICEECLNSKVAPLCNFKKEKKNE